MSETAVATRRLLGLRVKMLPLAALLFVTGAAILGQPRDGAASKLGKQRVVSILCERIETYYAFAENIQKVCSRLRAALKQGRYPDSLPAPEFARRVNEDLESVTHDKHFHVAYDPVQAAAMADADGGGGSFYTPQIVQRYQRLNYGFQEVRLLPGNIGYLDLRDFFPQVCSSIS